MIYWTNCMPFFFFSELAYFDQSQYVPSIQEGTEYNYFYEPSVVVEGNFTNPKLRVKDDLLHPTNVQLNKPFPCRCGRNYSRQARLTFHQKWECGISLMCKKCGKAFKNLYNFRYHYLKCKT